MDWRKYNLIEYRKGRYRLERQTWSFWDWALTFIVVCVIWRFWWVAAGLLVAMLVGLALVTIAGALLAFLSTRR